MLLLAWLGLAVLTIRAPALAVVAFYIFFPQNTFFLESKGADMYGVRSFLYVGVRIMLRLYAKGG